MMMLTIEELKQKIKERMTEVDLVDLLEITTDELVEAFLDKIEDKFDVLQDLLD
jgi:hypothetical protein